MRLRQAAGRMAICPARASVLQRPFRKSYNYRGSRASGTPRDARNAASVDYAAVMLVVRVTLPLTDIRNTRRGWSCSLSIVHHGTFCTQAINQNALQGVYRRHPPFVGPADLAIDTILCVMGD